MTDPIGSVTIGAREIYDQLVRLGTELGRVVAQLARLSDADETTQNTLKDHEHRIRNAERRLWAIPTAATLLATGSLIVAIVALVTR
jgi:flagellar basal body-associated protein FliL